MVRRCGDARRGSRVGFRGTPGPVQLLMLEASSDPHLRRHWHDVIGRWAPNLTGIDPNDPAALQALVTHLAVDGLWLKRSTGAAPLPPRLRKALAEHLARSVDVFAPPSADAGEKSK